MSTDETIEMYLQELQNILDELTEVYYEGEILLYWVLNNPKVDLTEAMNSYLRKLHSDDHETGVNYGDVLYGVGIPWKLDHFQGEIYNLIGDAYYDSEIEEKLQNLGNSLNQVKEQILYIAEQMEALLGYEYSGNE